MAKKKSESSPRERQFAANELFMTPLSERQLRELERLAQTPDSQIDCSDAPALKSAPSRVHVGRFYRPKRQISLKVDADVLAWFQSQGSGYQAHMNEALRREMQTRATRACRQPADCHEQT